MPDDEPTPPGAVQPVTGPDPDELDWPEPPPAAKADAAGLELFKAKVALRKARDDEGAALRKAEFDADLADVAAFSERYTTLVTGAIERRQEAAKTVQSAAGIIATLYTGVLAVSFSVTEFRLPVRGIAAPLFLGVAVVLSTYYLAWVDKPADTTAPAPDRRQPLEHKVAQRAARIGRIAQGTVLARSRALRASVIALGLGLVYLVLPFVSLGGPVADPTPAQDWPPATVAADENADLAALRYAEQLAEVRAAREAREATDPGPDVIAVLVAVGLGAVLVWLGSRDAADDATASASEPPPAAGIPVARTTPRGGPGGTQASSLPAPPAPPPDGTRGA